MWKKSYQRFDWSYDIFSHVKKVVWAFWLADIFLPKKFNTCSQANVNMEFDFVNLLRREIYDILSTKNLERSWRNTFVVSLRWNKPHGCILCTKTNRQMVRNFVFIFRLYFVVRQYIKIWYLYTHLYTHIINKLLHGWFVCTIFIIHSLWRIAKLTRSLRSLVRLTILHNSWIKIVLTHQPWSNLYFL